MTARLKDLPDRRVVTSNADARAGVGTPACPECGGRLYVDEHALRGSVGTHPETWREVRAAFCAACEYAHEF